MLDYRPVTADRVDAREHLSGALRNVLLLVAMLACVTLFLFLTIAGMGLMVMGVSGLQYLGLGIILVMLGLGTLFLGGWCLDSMR